MVVHSGKLTALNLTQYLKADDPMVVHLGKSALVSVQDSNALLPTVWQSGKLASVRLRQLIKAFAPITVHLGKSADISPQLIKA